MCLSPVVLLCRLRLQIPHGTLDLIPGALIARIPRGAALCGYGQMEPRDPGVWMTGRSRASVSPQDGFHSCKAPLLYGCVWKLRI